jgi:hypothetical protein
MFDQILSSFYDELEKIAEGQTTVVIKPSGKKEKEEPATAAHIAKGFAAGALPTAAGVRYLAPVRDLAKGVTFGLHPSTHSKLQMIAGLGAGVLGAAHARKHKKPSTVMVQL